MSAPVDPALAGLNRFRGGPESARRVPNSADACAIHPVTIVNAVMELLIAEHVRLEVNPGWYGRVEEAAERMLRAFGVEAVTR